ncbi:ABC transporter permease [Actinophytocola algeriensis]|uniref:Simple sugar transport system permease protein n=1 Tax=Actinophytocola algeriensis TaxID=1768010 RepID=A0A7W7QB21_9PSEU|nr:ABC transporter permease [Actinophytocola algeriensis]MBB4909881.1 simple sugar transport system permease protein [Actinophytocola algeriensis]MBE1475871.1 simple sugar transport system permease protein [Actinophytocola algeriensis]
MKTVAVTLLAALALGAILLAATGANPLEAYQAIVTGAFGPDGFQDTLAYAVPVVGMATALAIPLRAGMVNLGGEGQLVLGAISAIAVGLHVPGPLGLVAALVAGVLAGALYASIAAVCETRLGVPLLVTTLLLSYPAMSFAAYLVRFPMRDEGSSLPQSDQLPADVRFTELAPGLFLIAAVVVVYAVVDARTPAGFETRVTGWGPRFAQYAGIDRPALTVRLLACSGGLAGLVGAVVALGFPYRFIDGALITPQYTWIGLLAALLAAANPLGTLVAAVFFAALTSGGFAMERETQVPRELTAVLQAVLIIFLAAATGLLRKRRNPA